MKEKHIVGNESKGIIYSELEAYARGKVREYLQDLLEEEVSEWLGREKSERKRSVLEQPGYRNGYGRTRRFTMSLGTLEVRRPRVRDLGERFVRRYCRCLSGKQRGARVDPRALSARVGEWGL